MKIINNEKKKLHKQNIGPTHWAIRTTATANKLQTKLRGIIFLCVNMENDFFQLWDY